MLDLDNREVVLAQIAYALVHGVGDLRVGHAEAVRHAHVEDEVRVRGADDHAEVVDGECRVDGPDGLSDARAHGVGGRVVHLDGVHVDGRLAV
ncbi:MAG: hypothetical protein DBX61_09140, partial [Clostridiales bacterium]